MMQGRSVKVEVGRDFKRIHVNRNSSEMEHDNFSIVKLVALQKEINTRPWQGRHFYDNGSVPHGHSSI